MYVTNPAFDWSNWQPAGAQEKVLVGVTVIVGSMILFGTLGALAGPTAIVPCALVGGVIGPVIWLWSERTHERQNVSPNEESGGT